MSEFPFAIQTNSLYVHEDHKERCIPPLFDVLEDEKKGHIIRVASFQTNDWSCIAFPANGTYEFTFTLMQGVQLAVHNTRGAPKIANFRITSGDCLFGPQQSFAISGAWSDNKRYTYLEPVNIREKRVSVRVSDHVIQFFTQDANHYSNDWSYHATVQRVPNTPLIVGLKNLTFHIKFTPIATLVNSSPPDYSEAVEESEEVYEPPSDPPRPLQRFFGFLQRILYSAYEYCTS